MAATVSCAASGKSIDRPAVVRNLIPQPVKVEMLGSKTVSADRVTMLVDSTLDMPAEGYILESSKRGVTITARTERGAIWGERTLWQLTQDGRVPQLRITDYPAFELRGFMHDTGRNFMDVDTIKRHLDILSAYKVNAFQWHLTDYPAWRIESRAFPELNDPKNHRPGRDVGRFYTYDQIRDVIVYARERGIMVIPEIDIPGHSTYFNTTFGFGMDSPQGKKVLERCFDEFFAEIPVSDCPYMHIGSDEVHIGDPKGFMLWADSMVQANGRVPMAWDPGLPASDQTVRQIWSDAAATASQLNLKGRYVDSFMGYLNYYDPTIFASRMFLHNPAGRAQGDSLALGGILCLWNDVKAADQSRTVSHSGAWSGLLPFAERFWGGGLTAEGVRNPNLVPDPASPAGRDLAAFEQRMAAHKGQRVLSGEHFRWAPNAQMEWQVSRPVASDTTTQKARLGSMALPAPDSLEWHTVWGGAVDLDAFCTLLGMEPAAIYDLYAKTVIESASDTVLNVMVGFEAPARSNRLSVGIGEQGRWEGGARLWLNGAEVAPAVAWNEPGAYKYHFHTWHKAPEELPYTDEQFYWCRKPVELHLKKGSNTIMLYSPKTFPLQRWSFAVVPL